MAAPMPVEKIITNHFPEIDREYVDYITGMLDDSTSDDFSSPSDLYDTVGDMLLGVDDTKSENEILDICDLMLQAIGIDTSENSTKNTNGSVTAHAKVLNAPIQMNSIGSNKKSENDESATIWMAKKTITTTVDQKKLEKAEAKIKQKKEKRDNTPSMEKPNGSTALDTPSASQQSSRTESNSSRTNDIRIENFDIAFGDKWLLRGADVTMAFGCRYGLVGRNGIGKTTLLRMMSSRELRIPSHISILHVEQEVIGDDTIALQSVLSSDETRENLLKQERELNQQINSTSPSSESSNLSSKLTEIYQQLESIEADKAPSRAGVILFGLGFSPEMQQWPTKQFSGGWRMRLALARALFSKPDFLLLDEPTNMLDMKAIIWLEDYLQTWQTTILVVSHDRSFLNSVSTHIMHMHSQRIDVYPGDYEHFVKAREDRLKSQQREYESQKQYRDHIQVFIDRFRYNANRATQVQSKLKMLAKLPELVPVDKEVPVILKFPEVDHLAPPIVQLDEMTFKYPGSDRILFNKVDITACMESRICVVGENGAGKTTLLKILLGDLNPVSGFRHVHRNIRIGYFSQHHVDQLNMDLTCVEAMREKFPGEHIEEYRRNLGSFGISGDLALRSVASLSGGQKSRVAFALLNMAKPNFFILDEPTNHLDMETIEALGKALQKFKGGVILVSHDERLIRMICNEMWVARDGRVDSLEGGIEEYKRIVHAELADPR